MILWKPVPDLQLLVLLISPTNALHVIQQIVPLMELVTTHQTIPLYHNIAIVQQFITDNIVKTQFAMFIPTVLLVQLTQIVDSVVLPDFVLQDLPLDQLLHLHVLEASLTINVVEIM